MQEVKPLVPPLRFNTICPRIYRGSYPRQINYRFLKRYNIKKIISLIPDPITEKSDRLLYEFAESQGIQLVHFEVSGGKSKGKKRQADLNYSTVSNILDLFVENSSSNFDYCIYIHCLNGCHVTSLVVACFRKFLYWNTSSIVNEFILYSDTINVSDRSFIENYKHEHELKIH